MKAKPQLVQLLGHGTSGCSPLLMAACAEANVTISFLSENGRYRAAVVGYSPGNVLLRREQYR